MKLLIQMCIVFGLYWVSQCMEAMLPFPFPASVIGLLLLLVLLALRIIKPAWIREVSAFLTGNMAFLLVPVCVSIMNYTDLILENAAAFCVICVVSTVLTFAVTAGVVQLTCRLMDKRKEGNT